MAASIAIVASAVASVVASSAAAGTSARSALAPDKTTVPTTAKPPGTPVTTSTVPPAAAPVTSIVGGATVAASSFDGFAFLDDVFTAVGDDPFVLLDIANEQTVLNSMADLYIAHLLGVTITRDRLGSAPQPSYTVAVDGKAVSVCDEQSQCDRFSDFIAPTGLLESFSINDLPLTDSIGVSFRDVEVESVTVDSTLCLLSIEPSLGCVVLFSAEGASAAISWDQATFTSVTGHTFVPDLARSVVAPSIADGDVGTAYLVFPGAPREGDLRFAVVTGMTGVANTVLVSIGRP